MKHLRLSLLVWILSAQVFAQVQPVDMVGDKKMGTVTPDSDSGLVLNYPFSGNASNAAGTGNNGKVFGAVLTPDKNGMDNSAYSFNGTDHYILVDSIPSVFLGSNTKFIGCFINVNSYPPNNTDMGIVYMGQDPPQNYGATHRFVLNSSGKIGLNISHAFGFSKDISIPLNQWIYVFSYNQGSNFYVGTAQNGKVIIEKLTWTNWGAPQSNLQPGHIWIGRNISGGTGTGNYFNGMVDEVRFYNRALNIEEIDSLSNQINHGNPQIKKAKIVTLSVDQLPELGFTISNSETTIQKGEWLYLGKNILIEGGSGIYTFKWAPGNTLSDSTILYPVAFPTDTTNYILTVTDASGCSFSVGYKVNVNNQTVGSDIIPEDNRFNVVLYPNPNDGYFKVKLSGKPSEKVEIMLFDTNSRLIINKTLLNFTGDQIETFDLQLATGSYLIQIKSDESVITRQFIIN